jgi:hypothetical protein
MGCCMMFLDSFDSLALIATFYTPVCRRRGYFQSELSELETQLLAFDREDFQKAKGSEFDDSKGDWNLLQEKARDATSMEKRRLDLVMRIREVLEKYGKPINMALVGQPMYLYLNVAAEKALLRKSALLYMPTPSNQAYKAVYNTFWHKRSGSSSNESLFPTLLGASANILDDKSDLVALGGAHNEDRLTKVLRKHFPFFFRARESSVGGSVGYISEQKIEVVVGAVNILLAAAFLFGAIYNLYYVRDPRKTLGLVAGYTTAFAISVGLLTNARRAEIFGVSATYAAVLVVFVSGNLGSENNCCAAQS